MLKKLLSITCFTLSVGAYADPIYVDFTWDGLNGTTATGSFSYSDTLAGTGVIYGPSFDTFGIQAYYNSAEVFSWDLSDGFTDPLSNPLRFAWDTTAFNNVRGGQWPYADNSVEIGDYGSGMGALICGSAACGLTGVSGVPFAGRSWSEAQFTFELSEDVSQVPIPAAVYLFSSALLGLGVIKRRKV